MYVLLANFPENGSEIIGLGWMDVHLEGASLRSESRGLGDRPVRELLVELLSS